jgi:hypothetical protein
VQLELQEEAVEEGVGGEEAEAGGDEARRAEEEEEAWPGPPQS